MSPRIILFIILAVAIISSAQLATILVSNSPYEASVTLLWTFFLSLYIAATMWLSLIWYGIRKRFIAKYKHSSIFSAIRQSALFCMIIVLSFFFNSLNIFKVWDIVPLAIAAILIEFFFQAEKKPHATLEYEPES